MQAENEVAYLEELGVWTVQGPDIAVRCLGDRRLSSAWPQRTVDSLHTSGKQRLNDVLRSWFMFNDGAPHLKHRATAAALFRPAVIDQLADHIDSLVAELLPDEPKEIELVSEVVMPLVGSVISRVVGLDQRHAPRYLRWSDAIADMLVSDYRAEVLMAGEQAVAELVEAIQEALASPPEGSAADVLAAMVQTGSLDDLEAVSIASLLVYAGYETTTMFLSNALTACIQDGRLAQAAHDPERLVSELLIKHTSVPSVARLAADDLDLDGTLIPRDSLLLVDLTSSIPDDEAQLTRKARLTFGYGPHYCLGAGLAKLQATTLLRQLGTRWPGAVLAETPIYRYAQGHRAVSSAMVSLA